MAALPLLQAALTPACKLWQGSFCSAVMWHRSLFASMYAAGATVDNNTPSFTPLDQLSSDLTVPNHPRQARNSLPTFGLPIKGATLCHSNLFSGAGIRGV